MQSEHARQRADERKVPTRASNPNTRPEAEEPGTPRRVAPACSRSSRTGARRYEAPYVHVHDQAVPATRWKRERGPQEKRRRHTFRRSRRPSSWNPRRRGERRTSAGVVPARRLRSSRAPRDVKTMSKSAPDREYRPPRPLQSHRIFFHMPQFLIPAYVPEAQPSSAHRRHHERRSPATSWSRGGSTVPRSGWGGDGSQEMGPPVRGGGVATSGVRRQNDAAI
jgi:hypothetical protein